MLSVAILNWNTTHIVRKTLDILKKDLVGIDNEVLIVDNSSTDDFVDLISDIHNGAFHPLKPKIQRNLENKGTAVGKNQCVDLTKGDYILLLDGDVMPVPNSIPMLYKWLKDRWDVDAIGFCRNTYSTQENKDGDIKHEEYCKELYNPREYDYVCLYYGLFRRTVFDVVRCDERFSGEGYGWEDRDIWEQMKVKGVKQWVADINKPKGRYFHAINSSIRSMGHSRMMETSKERYDYFKEKWADVR